jgi:hypothetical protein
MTNLQRKFVTALATGAVLLSTVTSSASAASITVSGNGSGSNNVANVDFNNSVNVNQTNRANFNNDVNVEANTGNNSASDNTGGDVQVRTGDANVGVKINNKANTNVASVDACCQMDLEAKISGNGSDSDNEIDFNSRNDVDLDQDNDADFDNDVDVDAETGDNDADDNTGGDVRVRTGEANVGVKIANAANMNSAVIGGGEGGAVSAIIAGNGSDSWNDIDLDFNNDVNLDQNNDADFNNDVNVDADTGDNSAEDNTGGEVFITTGEANMLVELDNMANFNYADVDACGCVEDLEAKISGNGSDSDNEITFDSENDLDVDQDNDADYDNDVDGDLETGDNDADDNTGAYDEESDPSVTTGDANASVKSNNSGNMNVYGPGAADLEDILGDLNFTFDLGDLLEWLSAHAN